MARYTQLPRRIHFQHETVTRSVRSMAGRTPFDQFWEVFENKGTSFVYMTAVAELAINHWTIQHRRFRTAMGIVTVLTTAYSINQTMSIGRSESGLQVCMA